MARRNVSWVSIWIVAYYLVSVFFFWYGIKCIVLQQGNLIEHSRRMRKSFHLVAVHGAPAVTAGWSYICLGLCWAFLPGKPPEDLSPLAILRICLWVGCMILWLVLLTVARKQQFGNPW
jgi:hypothetical protein